MHYAHYKLFVLYTVVGFHQVSFRMVEFPLAVCIYEQFCLQHRTFIKFAIPQISIRIYTGIAVH